MTAADKRRLAPLLSQVREHLEGGIVPFWLARAPDRRFGGFLTNFDGAGRPLDTPEKYLNTQARLVWWFSRLLRRWGGREDLAALARGGVDFLLRHFWDEPRGGWRWKVRRDGSPLDDGKVVYAQSFAIYALSEYAAATGDARGLQYAERTFELLQVHCADTLRGGYYENLEPDWTVSPGGPCAGDRKSLDTHMHLMEAFTSLYAASGREIHRRKLLEVAELICRRMVDRATGCGRNQFDLEWTSIPAIAIRRTWNAERQGQAPAEPVDTTSYGHNVELAWLLRRAAETAGADLAPYLPVIRALLDRALADGVDWEYGGVYRDGTAAGGAIIHDKEFWQNAEVLVGLLDGWELFADSRCLEAFEKTWAFVRRYMFVEDVGEWRTLLRRDGGAIDPKIGNPWKVAYHTGRAMIECTERLERLTR